MKLNLSDKISFGPKKPSLGKAGKGKLNIEYKQIPLIIAAVIIVTGLIFYQEPGIMGNLIVLGTIVGVAPYALFSYFEYSKIKAIEDQLPIFLLDLAESQKVGLTLHESLKQASKTDYGKLTPEIKKVYNQLSWGLRVQDVFENFSRRMKKFTLLFLVCIFLGFCSFFRSKITPYPSGVIFPVEKAGEMAYKGKVLGFVKDDGGDLYLSTRKGLVYCLAGGKREILWRFEASEELTSSPFLGAENVYVYDRTSTLYCLSKKGRLLWKKEVKEKITTGIAEFKKKIYLGTEKGIFFSLATASGEELWRFEAGKAIRSTPVFIDERIIFGCDDHNFYILTEKGSLLDKI